YEETHVHGVYEAIAPHFSATRHKPWPFVSSFLASRPAGSVGLDVGCGNGKNMGVNRDVVMLGCDRSAALVSLARDMCTSSTSPAAVALPGADAAVADSLDLPFRDGRADFVICIAVIHHLSTRERRVDAIRQLLRCVRRDGKTNIGGGQVLVYVWALEQGTSRRGWDEGGEQDLLVPWVMKAPQQKKKKEEKTFHRFYHLYKKGELEEDVLAAGGEVLRSGYERDNWWVI
ncbi:S-adenosyl-L-methionine-dependent methyltransferase, partial [Cryphonectria parasitica EP155]